MNDVLPYWQEKTANKAVCGTCRIALPLRGPDCC